MAKCTACKSTILFGGIQNRNGQYCDGACESRHYVAVAEETIPRLDMIKVLDEEFAKSCPRCNGAGPLDLHGATKITSYIVAYTVSEESIIACVKCGKSHKLKAGLHTLFLGIWSPRGLIYSLFVFPKGIIGSLVTSVGRQPSKKFELAIKAHVGEKVLHATRAKA